jgi:hypothetical protein
MSEDQWLQERTNVVEDLKLRFRQNQIEQEGNDPAITGTSFGTPHDLATVHMSSNEMKDKDKGGRPKEGIKFGQHKNEFGWDPTGMKGIKQEINPENQKTTFQPDNNFKNRSGMVAVEHHDILKHLKSKNKGASIITESLKSNKISETDTDAGTLLDENNIL